MSYKGRLGAATRPGHWQLELEGSLGRIELLERDFPGQVFKAGHEVRDFAIAFNYLGPIADPLHRYEVI
ncbi:hypothetical protein D3C72_2372330 [compost metagenome]